MSVDDTFGRTPLMEDSAPVTEATQSTEQLPTDYDAVAQVVINELGNAGCFQGWDSEELVWSTVTRSTDQIEGLERRVELVAAIERGVPSLRDRRLNEAYEDFLNTEASYYQGTLTYIQLKRLFVQRGLGDEEEFLGFYQSILIDTLANREPGGQVSGESVIHELGLARVPLGHAQQAALNLPGVVFDDSRWSEEFLIVVDGVEVELPLQSGLFEVARRTLDHLAAGDFLSIRYNVYSNFAWLGSSVWRVIVEADLLQRKLNGIDGVGQKSLQRLSEDIQLGEEMLFKFYKAHREDPGRIKPKDYWYGQPYSYLTRDMIDVAVNVVDRCKELVAGVPGCGLVAPGLPALLKGTNDRGSFLEYSSSGRQGTLGRWHRLVKMAGWLVASWRIGAEKRKLARAQVNRHTRLELGWRQWLDWAEATLQRFDIEVKVTIDPGFYEIVENLDLTPGKTKVLFLPTHQSLLDHPVMYQVLNSEELRGAMGWEGSQPCVMLARRNLAASGVKLGPWSMTMFGVTSDDFDELLEEVDGYVTRDLSGEAGSPLKRVVDALDERPAVIYPMATTAAFGTQLFPLQHPLFASLPQDVMIIPIALRGIHSLWPKTPRGNMNLNPGVVEAVVSPPLLGETTLMPKRRSLRFQLETAALVQAVHITSLLNPEPKQ